MFEADAVARSHAAERVEIGVDDDRDLRIAADRLAIDAEDDRLSVARHLYAAGANRFGDHFAARAVNAARLRVEGPCGWLAGLTVKVCGIERVNLEPNALAGRRDVRRRPFVGRTEQRTFVG